MVPAAERSGDRDLVSDHDGKQPVQRVRDADVAEHGRLSRARADVGERRDALCDRQSDHGEGTFDDVAEPGDGEGESFQLDQAGRALRRRALVPRGQRDLRRPVRVVGVPFTTSNQAAVNDRLNSMDLCTVPTAMRRSMNAKDASMGCEPLNQLVALDRAMYAGRGQHVREWEAYRSYATQARLLAAARSADGRRAGDLQPWPRWGAGPELSGCVADVPLTAGAGLPRVRARVWMDQTQLFDGGCVEP